MSALIPGLTGGIYGKKNKYVAVFRFCDILIFFGTLSMSFRMCGLALIRPRAREFHQISKSQGNFIKYIVIVSVIFMVISRVLRVVCPVQ